jgi:hypothetical protein
MQKPKRPEKPDSHAEDRGRHSLLSQFSRAVARSIGLPDATADGQGSRRPGFLSKLKLPLDA